MRTVTYFGLAWALLANVAATGLEFTPMIYGGEPNAEQEIAGMPQGARYLLGFNEPRLARLHG